jgi:EthD domain
MEKLLYSFHRKPGLTRAEFFDHYLGHHAPLGLRLSKLMDGYTVNLTDVDVPDAPDAFTEIWTTSATDFMNPEKSFARPEDVAELMADHKSFIGPFDVYLVDETVVRRRAPSGVAKRFALYGPGESPLEPGPEVVEVVENYVVRTLMSDAAPVALIITTWAPTLEALGPRSGRSYDVSEHRMKDAFAQH